MNIDKNTAEKIIKIAESAGSIIMKYYKTSTEVIRKSDGSPVTAADKRSEEYIIYELKSLWSDTPAIGEESAASLPKDIDLTAPHWLIDPLDGTREFIEENDEFTVNIALIEEGRPVFGVIHAPALNLTYAGGDKIDGAFKIQKNAWQKLPLYSQKKPAAAVSRAYAGTREMKIIENIPETKLIRAGSSIKFCKVAEGEASFYLRDGRTMHWDSAAGHAIIRATKGSVLNWKDKTELCYLNRDFTNQPFIACAQEWIDYFKNLKNG